MECQIEASTNAKVIHKIMIKAYAEYAHDAAPSSALSETVTTVREALLNGQQAIVGSIAGQPIAMVRFSIDDSGLHFFRMAVLPTMQGLGIAKQLINELERIAKAAHVDTINCRVRVSVLRNLQLYQSKGYSIFDQETITTEEGVAIDIVSMKKIIA
ncbi:GNAT family N-acetyltransferase [Kurthia sibirica]|uniref:GNAT family N-acetyltransferase n=1 Tax=Kurthia sibirica TaxID=202750 RepID=A0A2U3ANC7_9BACL|nr:GNAT family N-acetyltransferase [Kurthia sibirica]PWI26050.1 GNAT family N-acetyltransferase [Kurthia sibirica]GEK34799.1 hypothetical protein KSI01_23320 [Kurthia sibirica]